MLACDACLRGTVLGERRTGLTMICSEEMFAPTTTVAIGEGEDAARLIGPAKHQIEFAHPRHHFIHVTVCDRGVSSMGREGGPPLVR
jgi:hypothetical protein